MTAVRWESWARVRKPEGPPRRALPCEARELSDGTAEARKMSPRRGPAEREREYANRVQEEDLRREREGTQNE